MFQCISTCWLKRKTVQISAVFLLAACQGATTLEGPYQGPYFDDKETIAEVQRALSKYGYQHVPSDGILGNETKSQITRFMSDTAHPFGETKNERLLDALGLLDLEKFPDGTILVVDRRAAYLDKKMRGMNSAELRNFLPELHAEDRRLIDLTFSRPKSVIFIIYNKIEPGANVLTFASNIIRGKRNSWYQTYRYKVDEKTPTGPMIIINEFETGNPMYLYHELYLNDKLIARRLTRANN